MKSEPKPPTGRGEPTGFVCPCGERHRFGAYVAAHWRERLTHTCPACGQASEVYMGRVTRGRKVLEAIYGGTDQ